MLLRFEATNHRSIAEPIEISMVAVDEDRPSVHHFERLSESVLTVAGIYGPNASGKSTILDALAWIGAAVERSLRSWEDVVPREPFRFRGGPDEPSMYEVELVVAGVRYIYRVEVDDSSVMFEGLYSFPLGKRRTLFEREGSNLQFRRGLVGVSGTRELLTPTTLALSAAMRVGDREVRDFGRSLTTIRTLGLRRRNRWRGFGYGISPMQTARLFEEPSPQESLFDDGEMELNETRDAALALLRFADLGINDVVVTDDQVEPGAPKRDRRALQFTHRAANQDLPFDLEDESEGTRTWFRLIGPVLSALRRGRILLFDEIDASLHPRLSARLLDLFQDPETNPLGAQLVFTTHDTSLLNHLNRDEVWLTEKGTNGATTLTALAEYGGDKVRRSMNLERAYLQGRFGAVPELDQYLLKRALGLATPGD